MKNIKSSWTKIVNASTVPLKDTAWREFKDKYGQVYSLVVDHIEDEWLRYSTARHFLHCYTGHVLHFGNLTTSRAEGGHWVLKRDIRVISNNDLLSCIRSFEQTISDQHYTLKDRLEDARIRRPTKLLVPLYCDVIGKVSPHALYKVHALYERYLPVNSRNHTKPPIPDSCTGVTTATMGIPCIHLIKQRYDTQQPLNMQDFHRHWHITQEPEGENEPWELGGEDEHLERAVVQGKGQPRGVSNKRKSDPPTRDLSQFDITEQASTQASSTARRQQSVSKRRRIGYVEESRASSPEPPEPRPLEELIAIAMQPEQTESLQGEKSSELQEISSEQWKDASNSDKAVKNKGKGGRRRVTDGKVAGVPEHMTGRFQI
jgi:hypothetical protein